MPWFVYIIRCGDGTLYTGIATDVRARLDAHRTGAGAKYTRGRGPLRLVYHEEVGARGKALRRELHVKGMPRSRKLQLIRGG